MDVHHPVFWIASVPVLMLFITSSDSGSLATGSIMAGGKLDAPVPRRVLWAARAASSSAAS